VGSADGANAGYPVIVFGSRHAGEHDLLWGANDTRTAPPRRLRREYPQKVMLLPMRPELTKHPPGTHKDFAGCRKIYQPKFPHALPIRQGFSLKLCLGFSGPIRPRSGVYRKHLLDGTGNEKQAGVSFRFGGFEAARRNISEKETTMSPTCPPRGKLRSVEHHPALPWTDVGRFIADLTAREGVGPWSFSF
jgi:hypothetical protein